MSKARIARCTTRGEVWKVHHNEEVTAVKKKRVKLRTVFVTFVGTEK